MIGGFVAAHLDRFTEGEVALLETLLAEPDGLLSDWLTGRREIPAATAVTALLRAMRAHVLAGGAVQRP